MKQHCTAVQRRVIPIIPRWAHNSLKDNAGSNRSRIAKAFKRVGIAADHGGFELKEFLAGKLREAGYEVSDFGDRQLKPDDDYPDFVIPWPGRLPPGRWIAASASAAVGSARPSPRTKWQGSSGLD